MDFERWGKVFTSYISHVLPVSYTHLTLPTSTTTTTKRSRRRGLTALDLGVSDRPLMGDGDDLSGRIWYPTRAY